MKVRGQLAEIVSLVLPCGFKDQIQVIRLGGKHFYILSNLASPYFKNKAMIGLELLAIALPQPFKCWDYRDVPPR